MQVEQQHPRGKNPQYSPITAKTKVQTSASLDKSGGHRRTNAHVKKISKDQGYWQQNNPVNNVGNNFHKVRTSSQQIGSQKGENEYQDSIIGYDSIDSDNPPANFGQLNNPTLQFTENRDNRTWDETQQTVFGKISKQTDNSIYSLNDQIKVCNIIQKRFVKQGQNQRVNAQGLAKNRIHQKYISRLNDSQNSDGIDANVQWPQNVPGLSRPPILDKISTKHQLSTSHNKNRGSSRKSKFEMDESRFAQKGNGASRMNEYSAQKNQIDIQENIYNTDWKVTKDRKDGQAASMMSSNKYGGPQIVRGVQSESKQPGITTSPHIKKKSNVKLEGIDVSALRGPLFKTADRGNYPKSQNASLKGAIITEPDNASQPIQVDKIRNAQKSTINQSNLEPPQAVENQAQTVEEILEKLKQKYNKGQKKNEKDPSSGVQMIGKTQWQIPSTNALKENYKRNEKQKMDSYITNLSNNQPDMEGFTLAQEIYQKQKKKHELTEKDDKLQEYVHNFSDAADLFNVRSADNSSPNKMMGFAAAIKFNTQKHMAMANTGNAILDMMRGFKRKRELADQGLTEEEAAVHDVSVNDTKHTVFDKRLEEESKTINNIAQDLLRKVKYQKIYKSNDFERAQVPFNRGVIATDDPRIKFFQECRSELDVCLPILDKILRKTIYLQDYSLSDGHCKGLAVACQFFDPKIVNRILFSNCGINGDQFAMILEGLAKLNDFKSIVYKMNGINQRSIENLGPLLRKRLPHHLEELKIIDCKMSGSLIESLLKLLMEQSQLRKLALVNILHSDGPFLNLVEYLEQSKHLEELDISWSTVRPQTTRKLIDVLKDNKQLTCLSLAYNQILSVQNTRELTEKEIAEGITEVPLRNENLETMECFLHFIKYNPYLIHLDLQSCGFQEPAIRFIGKMLTRSQSLRSIHLCNNPGISSSMIEWLKKRIRAADIEEPIHIKNYKKDEARQEDKKPSGMQAAFLKLLGINQNEVEKEHQKMKKIRQGLKLRNVVASKRMNQLNQTELMRPALFEESSKAEITTSDSSKLIIQRHLGYKAMIPGDAQWRFITAPQEECWHCGQHILTLFIWTPRIGQLAGIKDKQMINYYKSHLENIHMTDFLPTVHKAPQIASSFTNWKYVEMRPVEAFCQKEDPFKPDFIGRLIDEGLIRRELKGRDKIRTLLNESERELLDRQEEQYYKENWSSIILEIMRYKNPLIANISNITSITQQMEQNQEVYFHIAWVKPGRHVYAVEHTPDEIYEDDEDHKDGQQMEAIREKIAKEHGKAKQSTETFYLHEMLAGFRLDDVPHYCKTRQVKEVKHDFYKPKPVFSTFVKDTPEILAQCMNADKRQLKLERIMEDDNDNVAIVEKHIANHYQVVKDIYTILQASSKTYPFIDTFTFRHYFVEELGLTNDGYYVMANFDAILSQIIGHNAKNVVDGVIIPIGSFCRYQFIELCLRMSKFLFSTGYMYRKGGRLNQGGQDDNGYGEITMQRAFYFFIDEMLVPYYQKIKHKFNEFREDKLWDKDVEVMYTMNEKAIQQLYRMYAVMNQGKNGKPHNAEFMTVTECIQLMKFDSPLKLTRATIRQAFALCKMSVVNELDKKSQVTYIQITYVEFLEFLARISELVFADTEMVDLMLSEKIGLMLDDLLTVVDCERVKQKIIIEEFSESDDDY